MTVLGFRPGKAPAAIVGKRFAKEIAEEFKQKVVTRAYREALELTFKMMNAETQLLYASDYPHWDMDLPSTIYDLPFLSEQGKRNILGLNAARLFNLDPTPVKKLIVA